MNKDILPVLDEISAILKKHDMAGLFMVSNKTHTDFRMEISPSWSCAKIETDGKGNYGIRIRSKLAEYPNVEAQKKSQEQTIGTFVTFGHTMTVLREQIDTVLRAISMHVGFFDRSTREE